jgi:hypothetical protein
VTRMGSMESTSIATTMTMEELLGTSCNWERRGQWDWDPRYSKRDTRGLRMDRQREDRV